MDTKLFARIGAIAFVAIAITMSALQLREKPVPAIPQVIDVSEPDSDPLPDLLRQCSAMGEAAASARFCHEAWAEKRRRFLGGERPGPSDGGPSDPAFDTVSPPVPSNSQGGQ